LIFITALIRRLVEALGSSGIPDRTKKSPD